MKIFLKNICPIFGILLFNNLSINEKLLANTKSFEWQPIGIDQYGNIKSWINLKSYKELNKDSFRIQIKLIEENKHILGRLDINCRNKDFYLRKKKQMSQKGAWNSISKGSSVEEVAKFYCLRTSAAEKWGYTDKTKYLWNSQKPTSPASDLEGSWITLYKNNSKEFKYNSSIKKNEKSILAAYYYRKSKKDNFSPYIASKSKYGWIIVSCKNNLHSVYKEFEGSNEGSWMPPQSSPIGGGADSIRKAECYKY